MSRIQYGSKFLLSFLSIQFYLNSAGALAKEYNVMIQRDAFTQIKGSLKIEKDLRLWTPVSECRQEEPHVAYYIRSFDPKGIELSIDNLTYKFEGNVAFAFSDPTCDPNQALSLYPAAAGFVLTEITSGYQITLDPSKFQAPFLPDAYSFSDGHRCAVKIVK